VLQKLAGWERRRRRRRRRIIYSYSMILLWGGSSLMVHRHTTLAGWAADFICVLRNTLTGSKSVVSISRVGFIRI